jgi:hypothetical protein
MASHYDVLGVECTASPHESESDRVAMPPRMRPVRPVHVSAVHTCPRFRVYTAFTPAVAFQLLRSTVG